MAVISNNQKYGKLEYNNMENQQQAKADQEQCLSITDVLSGAQAVGRGLESLRTQHEELFARVMNAMPVEEEEEEDEEELVLQQCRKEMLAESLHSLETGVQETNLLLVVASYINSLEADRAKLKVQVRRMGEENVWLKEEMSRLQQALTDAEVEMVRMREENDHLQIMATLPVEGRRTESVVEGTDPSEYAAVEKTSVDDSVSTATNSLSESDSSVTDPTRFQKLHQRAINHMNQGRHEVAVSLCKKAAQEMERTLGHYHPDRAAILNIIVIVYRDQGKYKDAIRLLREVLEIREKCYGKNHQIVASTLNNLSVLYGKTEQYKLGESICRRALEIKQKLLGAHHPDVAQQLINLASLCQNLGNYEEVEWYYQRALEIYQTEFGPEDQNVIKTMNYLGKCYMKQGKLEAAEAIFKKVRGMVQDSAMATREHSVSPTWLGRESPDVSTPTQEDGKTKQHLSAESSPSRRVSLDTTQRQPIPAASSTSDKPADPATGGSVRSSVSANVLRFFKWGSTSSIDSSSKDQ